MLGVRISIHALREEGDWCVLTKDYAKNKFLSTPSARRATRGGDLDRLGVVISIHALREEGDGHRLRNQPGIPGYFYPRPPRGGRPRWSNCCLRGCNFYPRPPRGGRPSLVNSNLDLFLFLSTPSARRATCTRFYFGSGQCISIHALRKEGDRQLPRRRHQHHPISIHALREEGDPRCRNA